MVEQTRVRMNNERFPLTLVIHLLPGMDVFTLHRKIHEMRTGQALAKLPTFLNCGMFLLVFAVLLAKIFENKAGLEEDKKEKIFEREKGKETERT